MVNQTILTAFIIIGHKDWNKAEIKIYSISNEKSSHKIELHKLIEDGRLPISINNVEILSDDERVGNNELICNNSDNVDLTIIGFRAEALKHEGEKLFDGYDKIGNILFVNSTNEVSI